jgi:hypothetical protein
VNASAKPAADHPAPLRHRVDPRWLLASVAAGPTGWILQLIAGYAISSVGCAQARRLGEPSGAAFAGESAILIAINMVCLLIVGLGGRLSWRHWRRTRGEKGGDVHTALTIGEGRTRFIASCGVLSAIGFAIAILFNTLEPIMVRGCWTGAG